VSGVLQVAERGPEAMPVGCLRELKLSIPIVELQSEEVPAVRDAFSRRLQTA